MKITCHSCGAKYTVSDDKVQGKTVKIKCRKCGTTILVNSQGAVDPASAAGIADAQTTSGDAGSYLVNVGEGDQRSLSLDEIVREYNAGVVTGDTYVWADGMTDWQPLQDVEAIVAALNNAAGAPTATPEPAYTPAAVAAPLAAAAASPGVAAMAATEPVRAKRDAAKVDLFGGAPQNDRATGSPLFASPAASAPAATGQRDENSVLFSLNALTAKAATPAPSRSSGGASREDSGLIDLKALAASANTSQKPVAAAAAIGEVDAGIFPLGAPVVQAPPPVVAPTSVEAPKKSSGILFLVIGLLVGGAAIAGVFFFMKGEDPKKQAAEATATPTQAPAPPPTQAPSAAPPPEPTATSSVAAAETASAHKPGPRGPFKPGPPKPGADPKPGGDGGKPPPPKPKGNPCGCPDGDLNCAINCSAKKK